jgi:signal peptidase I
MNYATVVRRLRAGVAAILVLAIFVAAGFAASALARGTWMVNSVLSGSMRPGLAVGGIVISERIPVSDLAVRDVIVFEEPGKSSVLIVHRIVQMTAGKSGQFLIHTQGDANTARDAWALSIHGSYAYKVRWSIPLIGYIIVDYQNNRAYVLLAVGVLLIAIAAITVLRSRADKEILPSLEE